MAKQRKRRKKFAKPAFLSNPKVLRVTGFGLIVFGLFLVASFWSYLYTYSQDYHHFHPYKWSFLVDPAVGVHNSMGRIGSALSHFFFYRFGMASFLVVVISIVSGAAILTKGRRKWNYLNFFRYAVVSLALISVTLGLISSNSEFYYSGVFGAHLSAKLVGLIGSGGSMLLLFFAFLALLLTAVDREVNIDLPDLKLPSWFRAPSFAGLGFGSGSSSGSSKVKKSRAKKVVTNEPPTPPTGFKRKAVTFGETEDDVVVEKETDIGKETIIGPTKTTKRPKPRLKQEDTHQLQLDIQVPQEKLTIAEVKQDDHFTIADGDYDPRLDLPDYQLPPLDLLEIYGQDEIDINRTELEQNKIQIVETLGNYKISISEISATVGPTITLYEIVPSPGTRISAIKKLEDDIALSLAALGIRIIAPIPGKGTIGIEVPNAKKETVSLRLLLASEKFQRSKMELPIALGTGISHGTYVTDLTKMPHLLMAGATGQGKSVGINAILVSLLYKKHPAELKFVMVDPKKVELSIYNYIEKHFLASLPGEEEAIVTDTKKVINTLNALCIEMDQRYNLLKDAKVRNIKEYNGKFVKRKLNPEKGHRFLPYLVLVVDEFADLMMTSGKDAERPITRLAQLARAVGIHLIIATQRPSVNIITGTIKANFPVRIAFRVTSKVDSRTIIDMNGADQLIGRGDMIIVSGTDHIRLQGAFVDTPEIERLVAHIAEQKGYPEAFQLPEYLSEDDVKKGELGGGEKDVLFADAARVVIGAGSGSTSLIQRRLKLGYNRAGRLMDQLEASGIVGPNLGSKAREVYFHDLGELEEFLTTIL